MPSDDAGGQVKEAFALEKLCRGLIGVDAAAMRSQSPSVIRGTMRDVAGRLYIRRPFFGSAKFAARCGRGKVGEEC